MQELGGQRGEGGLFSKVAYYWENTVHICMMILHILVLYGSTVCIIFQINSLLNV